jgi:hypothetical protein
MTAKTKTAKPEAPSTNVCEDIAEFFTTCFDATANVALGAWDLLPDVSVKAGPGWTAKD